MKTWQTVKGRHENWLTFKQILVFMSRKCRAEPNTTNLEIVRQT